MPISDKNKVIGLIGSTGMAGTAISFMLKARGFEVREYRREVFEIGRTPVTALDLDGLDILVNCAGIINRRANEAGFEEAAKAVNLNFPLELGDRCAQRMLSLVHISTDCVFDGTNGPYSETDLPSATDVYGTTKLQGEPANAMVLRLSMVGPEANNYYSLLCWFLAQETECNGFTDHLWNGITTIQLGKVIGDIIDKDLYTPRLFHVHANDVSKYELLELFKKHFDKEITINKVASDNPRDMRLRSKHNDFLGALHIPPIDEQIAELKKHSDKLGRWCDDGST